MIFLIKMKFKFSIVLWTYKFLMLNSMYQLLQHSLLDILYCNVTTLELFILILWFCLMHHPPHRPRQVSKVSWSPLKPVLPHGTLLYYPWPPFLMFQGRWWFVLFRNKSYLCSRMFHVILSLVISCLQFICSILQEL